MNSKPKKNVVSNEPTYEETRQTVLELELKARYWEAMWKIRFYTLEAEKLVPEYEQHMEQLKEKQKLVHDEILANLSKAKEIGGDNLDIPGELIKNKEVANG